MASAGAAAAARGKFAFAILMSGLLVGLGIWVLGFASPDRLLERSYARVSPHGTIYLDDAGSDEQSPLKVTRAAATDATHHPVLVVNGAETRSGILSEPLEVGERVRIRTGSIESRDMEIQEVAELGAPLIGLPGLRLQLVTARTAGVPEAEPVQLIFAVRHTEADKRTSVSRTSPRAL